MTDHDLLLGDTITAILAAETEVLVELVADGIMWCGTPVTGAVWSRSLPRRHNDRTPLRDRLALGGYLHLEGGCYRMGEHWVPAGHVRLRLDSVSAWWLRGSAGEQAPKTAAAPGLAKLGTTEGAPL